MFVDTSVNNNMWKFEEEAWQNNYTLVAGGDEAGRGPLAGPVVASFVILPKYVNIKGIKDSKQLTRTQRKLLYEEIIKNALTYSVGLATSEEIDRLNILQATKLAFYRAINNLNPPPDFILLDFIKLEKLNIAYKSIVKGEQKSISIAAASIVAKETRDRIMEEYENFFPGYGFAKHKGYGTKYHLEAIKKLGVLPIHRKSFKPIESILKNLSAINKSHDR